MKCDSDMTAALYLECLFPWAFQLGEAQHELLLWKISEWADPFATLPSLSVFVCSAEKQFLPLTQPGMNLKAQKLLKWGEKLFWERGRKKIVIRYWCVLANSIVTYKAQTWQHFHRPALVGSLILFTFPTFCVRGAENSLICFLCLHYSRKIRFLGHECTVYNR